ncbi:PhnD/SsuA/transferrin family substrate-binding protein [Blastomonas sp.]|uniref:phosphate/phosphite/phosphonate ABC transporter substrate-binding protein n=1 Tax=Blastomonas sp. TaxID=1909299 RepID=UPI0026188C53|nr:PhnD/SsuA/transferrin family substrate-binding protein [Blastomonas sp.]MDM7957396.1 PhnD/SsuA/transferrin family substrate-binding protein [Blastomonas sp.]
MSAYFAMFGMYDHPQQQAGNDALWAWIAYRLKSEGLEGIPDRLQRQRSVEAQWQDPALLFGQCCGYPFARSYSDRLQLLAVPRYNAAYCEGTRHRSLIIARSSDPRASLAEFRRATAAVNDAQSNTGMNLLRHTVSDLAAYRPFFGDILFTGGHVASMWSVALGQGDIASIDAVSFAALARAYPDLAAQLKIIAISRSVPALPFVTSISTPQPIAALVQHALFAAMEAPELADARAALFLDGVEPILPEAYNETIEIERASRPINFAAPVA